MRLISPVKRDNTVGYELAHERLIPALREVAGKELTTAERANQLLDRRVNEWLGNQCSPRYLFNRQEFRLIQQQKPYLVWGTNRPHKEILFERSRKRLRHKFIALVMVLVFFVVGMGWWYSPIGQIQQVHWELAGLSKRVSYEYRQKAAVAFAKDKSFEQALEIVESIRDSDDKAWALIAIAKTYIKLENSKQAVDLLDQALAITQQIKSLHSKTWILIAIAETYIKLENLQQAERSLDKALTSIEQMKNLSNKAETLQKITKTIGSLRNNLKTEEFLERIWNSTHQISNANDIAMILIIMAQTYLKYKNKQQAQKLLSLATSVSKKDTKLSRKAMLFQIIGMTYTELGNLQQAEESLNIAGNITEQIQDSNDKARFLITIGETFQKSAFQQIEDIELSKNTRLLEKLLEQAYISAIKIKESNDKNLVLRAIAEIYIQLENNQHKGRYLEQALVISEQIEDSFSKAQVLRTVSEMYIKVGNSKRAVQYLEQALTITEHNKDSFSKALNFEMWDKMRNNLEIEKYRKIDTNYTKQSQYSSLSIFPITRVQILTYLVKTISKLENTPKKKKLLERVLADAEQNQYSYDKAQILTIIISTQGKLNLWRQAYKTVSQCPTDECRVESLAHILTTWAEKKNLVVE